MRNQKGGLKLKNEKLKGFEPVIKMLNSDSCNLDILTCESLKGFVVTLDVSERDSEYFYQNTRFNKPVTSFILKFAVITPTIQKLSDLMLDGRTIRKTTESKESFFEEAKLQNYAWLNSISDGKPEICPSVGNFSLFENLTAKKLLYFLENKTTDDLQMIFKYLNSEIGLNYEIGIILMPKVQNSVTFKNFINSNTVSQEKKNIAYSNLISQTIRLFISFGIIHFDLNPNNALIYTTPNNEIKCLIIDFGRASNITTNAADRYFSVDEKMQIHRVQQNMFEEFFNIIVNFNSSNSIKIKYISEIMHYLKTIDRFKNQQLFNMRNMFAYQMDWYENCPKDDYILLQSFNILEQTIPSSGTGSLRYSTIKTYKSSGKFIDFDKSLDSFYADFFIPEKCNNNDDELPGMCTVSGGKRKIKNKKTRKTRKNKKSKNHKNII